MRSVLPLLLACCLLTSAAPAAATQRLDVFVQGTDHALYQKWWDGVWHDWHAMGSVPGGGLAYGPALTSFGPNRLDVFVVNASQQLYHRWWDGSWSGWEYLDCCFTAAPAAVSWGPGRIDVFLRGVGNGLYHKWWQSGGWSALEYMDGGPLAAAPAVSSWGPGRLDLFINKNATLYHWWYDNGGAGGWDDMGCCAVNAPAAVSWGSNRIDLFAEGTDQHLYHRWWDGQAWSGWEAQGGVLSAGPAVASWGPNRLDVFVRGANQDLYHKWFDGHWNDWEYQGCCLADAPATLAWTINSAPPPPPPPPPPPGPNPPPAAAYPLNLLAGVDPATVPACPSYPACRYTGAVDALPGPRPSAPRADANYAFTGATSHGFEFDGVGGNLQVTNPNVDSTAQGQLWRNNVTPWYMAENSDGSAFIQVGWVKKGATYSGCGTANCAPRELYVYDTVHEVYESPRLILQDGAQYSLVLERSQSQPSLWSAGIFRNGEWEFFHRVSIPGLSGPQRVHQILEAYKYPSNTRWPCVPTFFNNASSVLKGGVWQLWGESNVSTFEQRTNPGYWTQWLNRYFGWNAGGCP